MYNARKYDSIYPYIFKDIISNLKKIYCYIFRPYETQLIILIVSVVLLLKNIVKIQKSSDSNDSSTDWLNRQFSSLIYVLMSVAVSFEVSMIYSKMT